MDEHIMAAECMFLDFPHGIVRSSTSGRDSYGDKRRLAFAQLPAPWM